MKPRLIYIILFLLSALPASSVSKDSKNEKFSEGISLFTAGNYDKALEKWLDLYNTGYRSAGLDYNIGNAYFKLNNTAGAILFFERAHLLSPADEDINYNLQIAKTLVVDRFDEIPELFFVRWYNISALMLRTNTWAVLSLLTFILFLLGLSLYLYSAKYRLKVTGFWIAVALLLVSGISFSLAIRSRQLVSNSHKAIIFSPQVSGKSSPDNSGNDLFVLHEGTKVSTAEKVGEWYEIRLSDGNKGWVPAISLEII
jgi:tetratricopeptide (TPR) repeat protein